MSRLGVGIASLHHIGLIGSALLSTEKAHRAVSGQVLDVSDREEFVSRFV